MDGRGFDDLTRKLAQGASRRSLLKALLGGAGAAAASAVVKHEAKATHCDEGAVQVQCPAGLAGEAPEGSQGGLAGVCCTGIGTCCSRQCIDFGASHEGACAPHSSEVTTTTAAPTTTTPAPTTTTTAPTTTTAGPTTTTAAPTTTTTGEPQVTICHFPPGNPENVQIITVGASAVAAHIAEHGDFIYTDCCVDDDCPAGDCVAGTCECHDVGEPCETFRDCCIGLLCYDNFCVECIPDKGYCEYDEDCCPGLSCFDNACKVPKQDCSPKNDHCKSDHDCCHGLRCANGKCRKKMPKPPAPKPEGPRPATGGTPAIGQLPATGVGDSSDGPSALGITLAGAAAALFAAKVLRQKPETEEGQDV